MNYRDHNISASASTTTITIPRHPDESPRAYAARIAYVTMGPGRSLSKLIDQKGIKRGSRLRQWAVDYGWVESARAYDDQIAYLTIQEAAAQHRADMEAHRTKALQAGRALYGVAVEMLSKLRAAPVEYTPATLATIARALTTSLDIEAHALGIDRVLREKEIES